MSPHTATRARKDCTFPLAPCCCSTPAYDVLVRGRSKHAVGPRQSLPHIILVPPPSFLLAHLFLLLPQILLSLRARGTAPRLRHHRSTWFRRKALIVVTTPHVMSTPKPKSNRENPQRSQTHAHCAHVETSATALGAPAVTQQTLDGPRHPSAPPSNAPPVHALRWAPFQATEQQQSLGVARCCSCPSASLLLPAGGSSCREQKKGKVPQRARTHEKEKNKKKEGALW